jgi:hypothetical protein
MAQPFDCFCGSATCRGQIAGAKDMTPEQLEGLWLNGHIRELRDEQRQRQLGARGMNGEAGGDPTARALRDALAHAEKVVEAARAALLGYVGASAAARRGPTSRELSGEMGGDTVVA